MTPEQRMQHAQQLLDAKTKPVGALGRLETLAARLAALQRTNRPQTDRARVIVFAADHGVTENRATEDGASVDGATEAGVSAYPRAVTREMVRNFAKGGAAVCVLARTAGAELEIVDLGVDGDVTGFPIRAGTRVVDAKVRAGSRNLIDTDAMTEAEMAAAVAAGRAAVDRAWSRDVQVLALGEMGIGNTTAAAALLAALLDTDASATAGRGTGVDEAGLARKCDAIDRALARHRTGCKTPTAPWTALAALGGLEIAALVGAMLRAGEIGLAVLVDGFIATVAALTAVRCAQARDLDITRALFFAHLSTEAGHTLALEACAQAGCDAQPMLDLNMRLGEASGATLALGVLRGACALFAMDSFADAGVSGPA